MADTRQIPPRRAGWYQRLFAFMLARTLQGEHDERKAALLGTLRGDVLEIGPGPGTNLAYYSPDVRWQGLEPNSAMFPYLHREAQRLGLSVHLRAGHAEHLEAADDTYDAVVSTLVLCSVRDQEQALREIRRVLKPGGCFVFIEHVAAHQGSGLRRVQQLFKPVWKPLGDGCHPDRETWAAIEQAGFSRVQLEHFRVSMPIASPHIAGVAVK